MYSKHRGKLEHVAKYLSSMIDAKEDIGEDDTHRIVVGWLKWIVASGILCDKQILAKLKSKSLLYCFMG